MPDNIWPQYSARLAGLWKCISYEVYSGAGPDAKRLAKPHGDEPLGRVQLSSAGYLSAHMAKPDRLKPLPSGKAWQEAGDAEVAYVARGLSGYCGWMELFEDEDGLVWQTRVDVSTDPSRVGGLEVRRVEVSEEDGKVFMTLRPERDMVQEDGTRARGVLKWEKIG